MPHKSPEARAKWWAGYYAANRQYYIAKARTRHQGNIEASRRANREHAQKPEIKARRHETWKTWYESRRTERIAYSKEWRARNPDKRKAICTIQKMNRRARERNAAGIFTFDGWMAKVAYYGWRCFYCHTELDAATLTIDHFKALMNGGTNWLANLRPACRSCNCSKQAKPIAMPGLSAEE